MTNSESKKRRKKGLLIVCIGLFFLCIWAGFEVYYKYTINAFSSKNSTDTEIIIEKGESIKNIARSLKEKNLIDSELLFLTFIKRNKLDTKIQAGSHIIKPESKFSDIVDALKKAEASQKTITLLEGWSLTDIKKYLASAGVDMVEFEDCLKNCVFTDGFINSAIKKNNYEGFFFPDTYKVDADLKPEKIINKIFSNFDLKYKTVDHDQIIGSDSFKTFVKEHTLEEFITVASMIEREVRTEKDRKMVSGIIWKRLEQGIALGIDATFLYVLGDWNADITYEVLKEDNPYNLRLRTGLPPSPISQPSLSSIVAAYNPEESDYLFYLTPDSGEVIYSKTLEEHNSNKQKYL